VTGRTPPLEAERMQTTDVAILLALATSWGTAFLFVGLTVDTVAPVWIVTIRAAVGGLALVPFIWLRRVVLPTSLVLWRRVMLLAVLNHAIPWIALTTAQRSIPSGLAALLMAVVPAATLVVATAIRLERLTAVRVAGLAVAFAGVAVIVAEDIDDSGRMWGIVLALCAVALYAFSGVYAKRQLSGRMSPMALAGGQLLGAAIVTLPVSLIVAPAPRPAALTAVQIFALIGIGVISTGLARVLFYVLMDRVGATNTTLAAYLIPVVAIVLGAIFLDERLGPVTFLGGGLVILGLWLSQRPGRGARAAREERKRG
jgi:drug/metabolite transporter (DMT)-like permease